MDAATHQESSLNETPLSVSSANPNSAHLSSFHQVSVAPVDTSISSTPSFESISDRVIEQIQQMISYLLNGYLTALCVTTGFLLNLFCIFVFLRCRRGSTPVIQYYLVTLTIWQTALLCNAFLLYCLPTLIYGHVVATGHYVYLYPYAYALANTTHTGSVWIVLTLTVDRYLALCRPLTHRAVGKGSRVKRLMIAVSLMAIFFSLPRFFEVHVVQLCITDHLNASIAFCMPAISRTELPENHTYWGIYHIALAMLFVTLVPCLLLFALTLTISLALRRAILKRRSLCAPNAELDERNRKIPARKEHKSNIMLVLVIAKFLISDILPTVADVLEHIVGNSTFMSSPVATLFVDFSNFLLVLNCSTNFWVFIIWGKRFRRSCKQLLTSTSLGQAFYKWTKLGSDQEMVTTCNQLSSYTMMMNTCARMNGFCGYGSDGNPYSF
uniref:G-protein coupled receptors family 1 profile domain-containing protein n=1 Tax=Parascaris univalens TaxID=6257 RepID=A0A915C2H6_PARUN